MNKKIYFSSVAAAALLSACSSDELAPQQKQEVADVLANRPKIEVAFGLETPVTRMFAENGGVNVKFNTEDQLGAVLVDQCLSTPANYFDLVTSNTHVANNKFYYKDPKFVTDGVMAVGSWLFYTPYNKDNTTSRGSIKYDLPIVQTYAQDLTELAKKDFRFSPITNLVGQEDGYFTDFNLPTISAYTYANVVLKFPQAVKVQKLVLKPSTQVNGSDYDAFAHTYELNMGTATDGLAAARADLQNYPTKNPLVTKQDRLDEMKGKLLAKDNYLHATTKTSGAEEEQLIALNCLDSDLEASVDFQSYMLIPSGDYKCIRLYAYTDKGIYVYNINDECEAAPSKDRPATLGVADNGVITLKREGVTLHNIAGYASKTNADYAKIETKAIVMTETKTNPELQAATETEGTVVISQKDLLAVINGISKPGDMNVRVLGDMVKITKAEADAIKAAEERVKGDIQVIFDKAIVVEGTAEGYTLTDVTFGGDATLTKGTVAMGADINIPASKKLTVNSGATLNAETVADIKDKGYVYNQIVNNGTVNAKVAGLVISTVENKNTLNVEKNATINTLTNTATATVNEGVVLTTAFTNSGKDAVITNNGTVNVSGESTNSSALNNNGIVNVQSDVTLNNAGKITNAEGAKIISGEAGKDGSVIANTGVIDNYGFLYCYNNNGDGNTINNIGTINAKAGSTTYITTNSSAAETAGTKSVKMGVINLDNRNEDISVTTVEQKGYIVWTTAATEIKKVTGDKFNKVVLSAAATVNDNDVRFIETSASSLTIQNEKVQELTFNNNATLYTTTATVAYLEIAKDKVVKVPTENVIAVENVTFASPVSMTAAQINNNGTLLVGGNLYSSEITACPDKGIFAAGDGGTTAFHWGEGK